MSTMICNPPHWPPFQCMTTEYQSNVYGMNRNPRIPKTMLSTTENQDEKIQRSAITTRGMKSPMRRRMGMWMMTEEMIASDRSMLVPEKLAMMIARITCPCQHDAMRSRFILPVFIFGFLTVADAHAQTATGSLQPAPPGFREITAERGVTLWRKGREYVQVVSLARGAKLDILQGGVKPSEGAGTQFERSHIREWWEEWSAKNDDAFSMMNAQFFNMSDPAKAPLAFSVKSDGVVHPGYGDADEFKNEKLVLLLGERRATVLPYKDDAAMLYDRPEKNAIVGLEAAADKSKNRRLGRTFAGVMPNGNVLLFSSPGATQRYATRMLFAFGAKRTGVLMLDGGASSQLVVQDEFLVPTRATTLRTVPQAIGVRAGN